jgi:hypothetical protein
VLVVVPPDWVGREDSAADSGLTGAPEGLESRLEDVLWLLESPPVAACDVGRPDVLGAFVSRLELAEPPPAKPLVSGARLVLAAAPDLNGLLERSEALRGLLLESPGCAALERTLASCNFSAPELAPLEVRARAALFALLGLLELALIFSALPVLVTLERNRLGVVELELRLGKFAARVPGFGASKGERWRKVMTCDEFGFFKPSGGFKF